MRALGVSGAPARKAARQYDVFDQVEIRHQVKLLEDIADVIGAQPVAPGRAQAGRVLLHQRQVPGYGCQDAGQKTQQGRLAAARRTADEQVFAAREAERVAGQQGSGGARPAETQVFDFDQVLVQIGST